MVADVDEAKGLEGERARSGSCTEGQGQGSSRQLVLKH